jgi:hypothetical protein
MEAPCIAMLNKQKCHFSSLTKLENRRETGEQEGKTSPVLGGWCQWEWGGGGEKV